MPINANLRAFASVGFLLLAFVTRETTMAAQGRLATATSVRCEFSQRATGTWKNGEPQTELRPAKLSVGFNSIDTQEGTAEAVAQFGSNHIIVRLSRSNLHFLEISTSGSLFVTTVFDRDAQNGKLQAVHTRHEFTDAMLPRFTSRGEQYYGECQLQP